MDRHRERGRDRDWVHGRQPRPRGVDAPWGRGCIWLNRGPTRLCGHDSMAATYELPVGKGKKLLSNNRALDLVVGGWSMNLVSVLQSGYPLAITQSNNNSVFGAGAQRPNATGVSASVDAPFEKRLDAYPLDRRPQHWFLAGFRLLSR